MKIFALFFLTFSLFAGAVEYDYVRVQKKLVTPEWIKSHGFIEDHLHDSDYLIGYLPRLTRLTPEERDRITTLDAQAWASQSFDIKTLNAIPELVTYSEEAYEEFHTYATLSSELATLASTYPDLVTLESAGKTVEGREMWLLRLSNKKASVVSKPKLLLISSMHGDEVTGKELMVYLSRLLLQKYGKEDRFTKLLDNNEIFIMPSMNPDGTEKKQRFNADGVDLNRDFPLLNEDPTDPNRAIEVRNIQMLHQKHHFLTALNYHGGEICFNIPWDSKVNSQGALFGDDAAMMKLARNYADLNGPMKAHNAGNFMNGVTYGYEWYPVYGGMQDWASHFYQSIHATIEVSQVKWPSASGLPGFWKDNQEAFLQHLEKSATGAHLKVTNAEGALLPVSIDLSSAKRTLKYDGYVHRVSSLATETVTVASAGYKTQTLNLTMSPFVGSYTEVKLEKAE